MSVVLYRQGNTHTVNGIDCELKLVRSRTFTGTPEEGWFLSPEEAYKESEEIKAEVLNYDKMSNPKIREHAKIANISKWKDARIQTLKDELKAL